jgi:hypothetical protein
MNRACSTQLQDDKCEEYFSQNVYKEKSLERSRRKKELNVKLVIRGMKNVDGIYLSLDGVHWDYVFFSNSYKTY